MGNLGLFLTTIFIWGTTWIAIKYQLGVVSPEVSVAYRFLIASGVLFLWARFKNIGLKSSVAHHLWFLGLALTMFSVNYVVTYYATETVTTGLIAVIYSTVIVLNLMNERLFMGTPIRGKMLFAATVAMFGILLVFAKDLKHLNMETLPGIGWAFLGTYIASVGAIVSAKMQNTHRISVLLANAYGMLYGALFTFAFALLQGKALNFDFSLSYMGSLAYLSLGGSAIAFCAYLTLIGRMGPAKASYIAVLFPIVALAVSYFAEDYRFSSEAIVGMGLIFLGNYLALSRKRRAQPQPNFDWRQLLRKRPAVKEKVS